MRFTIYIVSADVTKSSTPQKHVDSAEIPFTISPVISKHNETQYAERIFQSFVLLEKISLTKADTSISIGAFASSIDTNALLDESGKLIG